MTPGLLGRRCSFSKGVTSCSAQRRRVRGERFVAPEGGGGGSGSRGSSSSFAVYVQRQRRRPDARIGRRVCRNSYCRLPGPPSYTAAFWAARSFPSRGYATWEYDYAVLVGGPLVIRTRLLLRAEPAASLRLLHATISSSPQIRTHALTRAVSSCTALTRVQARHA